MSTKSFVILVVAVAALLAALVYMHRPRAHTSTGGSAVHGER